MRHPRSLSEAHVLCQGRPYSASGACARAQRGVEKALQTLRATYTLSPRSISPDCDSLPSGPQAPRWVLSQTPETRRQNERHLDARNDSSPLQQFYEQRTSRVFCRIVSSNKMTPLTYFLDVWAREEHVSICKTGLLCRRNAERSEKLGNRGKTLICGQEAFSGLNELSRHHLEFVHWSNRLHLLHSTQTKKSTPSHRPASGQ